MTGNEQTDLEVVQGIYESYADGDIEGFMRRLARDVTWIEPEGSPFSGTHTGPEAVRDGVIMPAIEQWEAFEVEPQRFIDAGETIVVLATERGTYKETGNHAEVHAAHVYDVEDGEIVNFENFEDTAMLQQAVQQTGTFPEPGAAADGGSEPYLLADDDGTPIWSFGVLMNIKATGDDTSGSFALVDHLADPGVEAPYHVHHKEEELFYVLRGEVDCYYGERGEKSVRAGPGDTVYLPRDIPHGFCIVSDEPCRMLVLVAPAGVEELWLEAGEPAPELTTPPPPEEPPDLDAIAPLAEQFGIEFLGPTPK